MPRRKTPDEFPLLPIPLADFVLYHEFDIRAAVKEARESVSFVGASNIEGNAKRGGASDRTGRAAVLLADGVSCVVLETGETVRHPEKWLACIDAVRKMAAGCQRPDLIFDVWEGRYSKHHYFIGETREKCGPVYTMPGAIVSFIRYHVLTEARARGLVSFSDGDIQSAVMAAAG